MRYYRNLAIVAGSLVLLLGGIQLAQWWGKVDVTVSLKNLNQQLPLVAVACPNAYYPLGDTVECTLESDTDNAPILMAVESDGLVFADEKAAERLIARLTQE